MLFSSGVWASFMYAVLLFLFNSLSYGLGIFQENKFGDKDALKLEANTDSAKVYALYLIKRTCIMFFLLKG